VTRPHGLRDESDADVAGTVRDHVALVAKLSRRIGRNSPLRPDEWEPGGRTREAGGGPMDSVELVTLQTEMAAQMREIERVYERTEERVRLRTPSGIEKVSVACIEEASQVFSQMLPGIFWMFDPKRSIYQKAATLPCVRSPTRSPSSKRRADDNTYGLLSTNEEPR
jgi:hypothetical protein